MPYVNRMTEVVIMYRRPTTELHPMEENEALAKEDPGLFRSIESYLLFFRILININAR